ncbi:MAG: hypothetical protein JW741_09500 [Sedimentisphaerales bacterium]|nr:hypothetical protein [Sedimentisphaerales bacterium]
MDAMQSVADALGLPEMLFAGGEAACVGPPKGVKRGGGDVGHGGHHEMCKVKLFLNQDDPGTAEIGQRLSGANIVFETSSTSGPSTIWVDDVVAHGPTAVSSFVDGLIADENQEDSDDRT